MCLIFSLCLMFVLPSLPPHLAFISGLFYSSLYNLQGINPGVFLIICIYAALDRVVRHFPDKKGTADSLILLVTV